MGNFGKNCITHANCSKDCAENVKLEKLLDKLKTLLDMAKCPCCDGSGGYYNNYGEATQCQWCNEVRNLK